ncbi:hypothetical protein [Dongia sp.]|uniref:hypothetical protein n=1 Tax=Dongia sp. TaxID=1977262 RepID=UPI0035B21BFF
MEIAVAQTKGTSSPPVTDEEQRKLCFDMFNDFWEDAFNKGVPFDTIGTMSISAALFALVAKHGKETTAEFVRDLVASIETDEFTRQRKAN